MIHGLHRGDMHALGLHAALTNNPALDGLTELAAASCVLHGTATAADIAKAACAYQSSMQAKGVHITTMQAVNHVSPPSRLTELTASNSVRQNSETAEAIAKAACAYQNSMAAKGVHITTVQAVNHVSPPTHLLS